MTPVTDTFFELTNVAGTLIGIPAISIPLAVFVSGASVTASGMLTGATIALAVFCFAKSATAGAVVGLANQCLVVGGLTVGIGGAIVCGTIGILRFLTTEGRVAGAVVAVTCQQTALIVAGGVGQTVVAVTSVAVVDIAGGTGLTTR